MGSTEYLVAKYVPDLLRNEPVNIGILAWVDGTVSWRFLGQRADGEIDGRGRGVRGVIRSIPNYKAWVNAWMKRASAAEIRTRAGTFSKASPEFLSALASYGEGNYILEAGGEIIDET